MELYNRYDKAGKDAVRDFFEKKLKGCKVVYEPFGTYGVDLSISYNNKTIFVEVEVRNNWTGEEFPFDTIHLPLRKRKFINPSVFYISLNKELNRGLVFQPSDAKLVEVKNKYVDNNEFFYDVPVSRCLYVVLK